MSVCIDGMWGCLRSIVYLVVYLCDAGVVRGFRHFLFDICSAYREGVLNTTMLCWERV